MAWGQTVRSSRFSLLPNVMSRTRFLFDVLHDDDIQFIDCFESSVFSVSKVGQ